MKIKCQLAILVVSTLLMGMLPMENQKAGNVASIAAERTTPVSYGLNNPTTDGDGVTTWDCVYFGSYWQEDTNGDGKVDKNDAKRPIKWRVLSIEGSDAFLLADKNLDVQRYNDKWTSVTWETCTIRSWLNGYGAGVNQERSDYTGIGFLDHAFSKEEQSVIRTTNVVNNNNPHYGTEGGNDTSDKVYLLSIDEVMNPAYGFTQKIDCTQVREAVNTAYVAGGGEINSGSMNSAESADHWWLRSLGHDNFFASFVSFTGFVSRNGSYVFINEKAVRPALHLELSSVSSWSYAGTVTSEKEGIGTVDPTPEVSPSKNPKETAVPTLIPSVNIIPTKKPNVPSTIMPEATTMPDSKPRTTTVVPPIISATPDIGKISSIKLKQKKQTVTASWKKVSAAAGYQICYSTSKKWKNKKQKLTRNNKLIVKKLKKKKTYYFRVRAYRINDMGKLYGAWSKTKKILIKK